jgi:hypothetical protein
VDIEFLRTGERRYAVIVHFPDRGPLHVDPAPGYDELMPHDLLHYAVECALDLRTGIFGRLAQGGSAGFRPVMDVARTPREVARDRRRLARRDSRIGERGREDSARSEAAVYAYGAAWRSGMSGARKALPFNPRFAQLCSRLDELSLRWRKLRVGESMTVSWPDSQHR